jgi:hypothetical protein
MPLNLSCHDDDIWGENIDTAKRTTETLLDARLGYVGIEVSAQKSVYKFVSRL